MSKHIDYEAEAKFRTWWLNGTGGAAKDSLTVRDYFAAKAMAVLVAKCLSDRAIDDSTIADDSYKIADEMMKARALDKQGEL